MENRLHITMLPQPDEISCGPTCLQAVYAYFGDTLPLAQIIDEVPMLEGGGTLGVLLACHALRRGYRVSLYTYKLQLFDPTWFDLAAPVIIERLSQQLACKADAKLHTATRAYQEFLRLGGRLRQADLTPALIRKYLNRQLPVIAGLSATFLYRSAREYGENCDYDDVRGEPSGHFVVLSGYERSRREVLISDPLHTNPLGQGQIYHSSMARVINAILLGVLTYDGNLIILEPPSARKGKSCRF